MSTSCGSPCYAAPELVMNQGVYVGPAVDIWSCGVILFAMLCGYLPYDDDPANPESYNINLLYKYILNTPLIFPDYISDEACDLLSLMLVPDPEKRCSMDQIMNHPWLAPHKHLFVVVPTRKEEEEEEDLVMEEDEEPTPEPTRRNTIANIHTNSQEDQDQVVPEKIVEEEEVAIVQQQDQVMQDEPMKKEEEEGEDITMQEITSIELPPPTLIEDQDETTVKKNDTLMTEKEEQEKETSVSEQPIEPTEEQQVPTTTTTTIPTAVPAENNNKEEELHSVSPLPTVTTSTTKTTSNTPTPRPTAGNKKIRPKSTVSSSTEKVLHFLSGHSNTPKPNSVHVVRNTNEKRTRHMSLATGLQSEGHLLVPPSPTTTTSTSSILHSKFLSSIQRNKTPTQDKPQKTAAPTPTATSASTPHPTKNNKRHVRVSTTVKPQPQVQRQQTQTEQRGTRRKTLSLLVNSMTDNKPFSNRRQSTLKSPAAGTPPPTTMAVTKEKPEQEGRKTPQMMPSVSEHTSLNTAINGSTTPTDSKEKHRSAGKKLMDWFKKKPLSKFFFCCYSDACFLLCYAYTE